MSRTVAMAEASSNKRHGGWLRQILDLAPESLGWSLRFKTYEDDEGNFRVAMVPVKPDGAEKSHHGWGYFALESVPVIKAYLHEIGALKLLYDETRNNALEGLARAREALMIDDEPPSRAEQVVARLREILYLTHDGTSFVEDPDKEWDSDTLDDIGRMVAEFGLAPVIRSPMTATEMAAIVPHASWIEVQTGQYEAHVAPDLDVELVWDDDDFDQESRSYFDPELYLVDHELTRSTGVDLTEAEAVALVMGDPAEILVKFATQITALRSNHDTPTA